jgi:radical SAM protein with 4Fe4S-binding SPASM domain
LFNSYINSVSLPNLDLWGKIKAKRMPLSFDLEVTARCNNNCHHCYICLPPKDRQAKMMELTLEEIERLAGEAVSMGAVWCLITGGEPLLRDDFFEIYMDLKRKGLLVSVFTNATLIDEEHIELFRKYPPRDMEVSVYGVTQETYEKVTRNPGSFKAFMHGLNLLLDNGIKVRLKAMAIRSNFHELPQIARFCRERTMDYFRFDPLLHLRLDRNQTRNEAIESERLTSLEIVALEKADAERFHALEKSCDKLINPDLCDNQCDHLFHCGAGNGGFVLGYDGNFRLCSSLTHPECVYDLRKGSLADAWHNFVLKVREMRSENKEFLETCRICPIINLCLWCPAHAYLEQGSIDAYVPYFCEMANARAEALAHSCPDVTVLSIDLPIDQQK